MGKMPLCPGFVVFLGTNNRYITLVLFHFGRFPVTGTVILCIMNVSIQTQAADAGPPAGPQTQGEIGSDDEKLIIFRTGSEYDHPAHDVGIFPYSCVYLLL